MSLLFEIFNATWLVIQQSAPWLLLGFFAAGLIHVLLPPTFVKRQFQKPGLRSVVKASAFGVPLPLCSCSVIPVAVSLRRSGASKGATASFMVSTPEIGVDSFLLSYGLLGPVVALARVVSAFLSALFVGAIISLDEAKDTGTVLVKERAPEQQSCCCQTTEISRPRVAGRIAGIFRHGFGTLIDDLVVVLMVGFLLSGVLTVLVPNSFFLTLGSDPLLSMVVMLFISFPLYVCATSSTPIAAALLLKGMNPGAVLVFLLAGPASNVSTMLAVRQELGKRALVVYIAVIAAVSLVAGSLLNLMPSKVWQIREASGLDHRHSSQGFEIIGFILMFLFFVSLLKKIKAKR